MNEQVPANNVPEISAEGQTVKTNRVARVLKSGVVMYRGKNGKFTKRKYPLFAPKPGSSPKPLKKPLKSSKKDCLGDDGNIPQFFTPGVRLVDLNLLAVKLWCQYCDESLSLRNCIEDAKNVFKSVLKIKCLKCSQIRTVALSWIDEKGSTEMYDTYGNGIRRSSRNAPASTEGTLMARACREANRKIAQTPKVEEKVGKKAKKKINYQPLDLDDSSEMSYAGNFAAVYLNEQTEQIAVLDHFMNTSQQEEKPCSSRQEYSTDNDPMEWGNDDCDDSGPEEKPYVPNHLVKTVKIALDGPNFKWVQVKTEEPEDMTEHIGFRSALPATEKCYYCDEMFVSYQRVRNHMANCHLEYKRQFCGLCGISFESASKALFNKHIRKHRKENYAICEICGENIFIDSLKIHMVRHMPRKFPCPTCPDKFFRSDKQARKHMIDVHGPSLVCDFCGKSFHGRTRLIEHIRIHMFNKKWACEFCSATFERRDNMKTHMTNNHNFLCLVCNAKFTSAALVKEHAQNSHTEEDIASMGIEGELFEKVTKFRCHVCLRHLASKQSLDLHINRTHLRHDKADSETHSHKKSGSLE